MRILLTAAAAATATLIFSAGGPAQAAARWCSYEGDTAVSCGYRSEQQCLRSVGRSGLCRREAAYRQAPAEPGMLPGQIYPSRPYWSSPEECFIDEGYGRFLPCNAGSGGDGGMR